MEFLGDVNNQKETRAFAIKHLPKNYKKMEAEEKAKEQMAMPKFLEDKLKKEYGAGSDIPYKVMNSMGAMHGNKETAKGAEMQRKHEADMAHSKKKAKHKKLAAKVFGKVSDTDMDEA